LRQIGLAVGRAIQRERIADRRHRAQALRTYDLIDKDQMIFLDGREVDGFMKLVRKPFQKWPRLRNEVAAH
jgi:hypothetical protein